MSPTPPPAIDPQQTSERKELANTEIQNVPYPAPQDYRNSLPLLNGVVQDNAGRVHFNGGDTNQANYTLDGFNISDPVTGRLETRVNIDTIQSMDLENSRYAADNGRGSAGVLDVKTKMGDDRLRFGGTNFIPGVTIDSGLYVNKWTPRLEFSGPLVKGRAWFHNGLDAFYSVDSVHGLPSGQNRTSSLTASDLSRFQVNLTPANILTASFLYNRADSNRNGLSILNPVETTTNSRQALYMSTIRDQHYFGGALLDVGFADTRGLLRNPPRGDLIYEITPSGNRGNYFSGVNRHWYRQQTTANLFLPTVHFHGDHHLKFGVDVERESFHQQVERHDYEVLRDDNSVARLVTFAGMPFQNRKNLEAAQYVQDHWTPMEGLALEGGVRTEWNEVVRDLEVAPRVAAGLGAAETARHQDFGGLGSLLRRHRAGSAGARTGTDELFHFLPAGWGREGSGAHLLRGERPHALDAAIPDREPYRRAQNAVRFLRQGGLHLAERLSRVRLRHGNSADRADVLRRRGLPAEQLAARPLRCGRFRHPAYLCRAVRVVPRVYAVQHTDQRGRRIQPGKPGLRAADAGPVRLGHAEPNTHVGLGAAAQSVRCGTAWSSSCGIPPRRTWWNIAPASRSASWIRKASWWARPTRSAIRITST